MHSLLPAPGTRARSLTAAVALLAVIAAASWGSASLAQGASGDFDGDGREDRAVLRRDGDVQRVLVMLAARPGEPITVAELHVSDARAGDIYLNSVLPGDYTETDAGPDDPVSEVVTIEHDALAYGIAESSAWAVYWTGEAFARLELAD